MMPVQESHFAVQLLQYPLKEQARLHHQVHAQTWLGMLVYRFQQLASILTRLHPRLHSLIERPLQIPTVGTTVMSLSIGSAKIASLVQQAHLLARSYQLKALINQPQATVWIWQEIVLLIPNLESTSIRLLPL